MPDFPTIGAELTYWLTHIGQHFKGGWSGSGENGIDVSMPVGTPVYAVAGGPVVGAGYYGGGGVVSVEETRGRVWYYQHLDLLRPDIESGQTRNVQAGELVGWSGGQSTGGHHPSSLKFSNDGHGHGWPHIEVGINAPWGGIWGPMSEKSANVDPLPILQAIAKSGGSGSTGQPQSFGGSPFPSGQDIANGFLDGIKSRFGVLWEWITDPLRIFKFVAGCALVLMASLITAHLITAEPRAAVLEAAGAATGQPELVSAGNVSRKPRNRAPQSGPTVRITPEPVAQQPQPAQQPPLSYQPASSTPPSYQPTQPSQPSQANQPSQTTVVGSVYERATGYTAAVIQDAQGVHIVRTRDVPAGANVASGASSTSANPSPPTRINPDLTAAGGIRDTGPHVEQHPVQSLEPEINPQEQANQESAMRWFSQKGSALDDVMNDLRSKQPNPAPTEKPKGTSVGGVFTPAPPRRNIPTQAEIKEQREARERAKEAGYTVRDWRKASDPTDTREGVTDFAPLGTTLVDRDYMESLYKRGKITKKQLDDWIAANG